MNEYSTTESSKMTNSELVSMCGELFTAKNWGCEYLKVSLSSGEVERVRVNRLPEYQNAVSTVTGAIL